MVLDVVVLWVCQWGVPGFAAAAVVVAAAAGWLIGEYRPGKLVRLPAYCC